MDFVEKGAVRPQAGPVVWTEVEKTSLGRPRLGWPELG
jgi:hypothetical protein